MQSAAGKVVVTKPIGFDRKKKQGRGRPCYATSRQAGLSSFVVEQAAEFAIRAMLRDCGSVKANISANDFQLLGGAIDGVTIDGREWCSPLGLRCRSLHFEVSRSAIDVPQVLLQRRIVLANVPVGSARVHFSESDFGTFLTHPLMRSKAVVAGHVFRFLPRGIAFREASGGAPLVVFRGVWGGDQMAYTAELQPSGTGSMRCQVLPSEGGESPHCGALGGGLARFFEGLMIDLQGAELRFRSMDVERLPGGPVLNLQLSLRVREFPPLDVKF